MASFVDSLLRHPNIAHRLINERTGGVVAHQLLTAFDSASRRRGLLGRDSLEERTALLIAPSNAVHTFFMRFSIDVAFVTRDGRVLKVRHAVPPRRITAAVRAFAVAELPAGTLMRSDVRPGDRLVVTATTSI
jgi:uncharacterized protein